MKCKKCGGRAVLELRRHNTAFCADDFLGGLMTLSIIGDTRFVEQRLVPRKVQRDRVECQAPAAVIERHRDELFVRLEHRVSHPVSLPQPRSRIVDRVGVAA